MAAVTIYSDFGAPKIKSDTVSTVSPSISHEVMGPDDMTFAMGGVPHAGPRHFTVHLSHPYMTTGKTIA